jgi:excisionase family DNA binding protein
MLSVVFLRDFSYDKGGIVMARQKQTEADMLEEEMTSASAPGSDLLTVREVARHLRVDDTTVRRWIKSGALDAVALPHSGKRSGYRVRKKTLDALFSTPAAPQS